MTAMMWKASSHWYMKRQPRRGLSLPRRGRDKIASPRTVSRIPYAREHLLDVSDWCVRQNAVAEIENKRPTAERCENCIDAPIERRAAGAQRQWIEIALHRPFALDCIARKIQIHHPVETHGIDFKFLDVAFQIAAGTARKPDELRSRHRTPHIGNDSS